MSDAYIDEWIVWIGERSEGAFCGISQKKPTGLRNSILVLTMVYIHERREIEVNKDNTILCFRTQMNIKHTFEGYEGLSASINVGWFLVHLLSLQCEPPRCLEHFLLHFRGYFDGEWDLFPLHLFQCFHLSMRFL
jgi:hypothetical protein